MFKFSNNNIQVFQNGSEKSLIVTDNELVLVTIKDGIEISKIVENK